MSATARVLLLTGMPGMGKTTVIRRVDFNGGALTFAHIGFAAPRVFRYGVGVAALDARAEALLAPRAEVDAYLVDEIGKQDGMPVAALRRSIKP